jgi:hypothetical protein
VALRLARLHPEGEHGDQDKDGRLMAAASDLLEACKAFVEAWEKSHQLEKTDVALRLSQDAIAKVEGAD